MVITTFCNIVYICLDGFRRFTLLERNIPHGTQKGKEEIIEEKIQFLSPPRTLARNYYTAGDSPVSIVESPARNASPVIKRDRTVLPSFVAPKSPLSTSDYCFFDSPSFDKVYGSSPTSGKVDSQTKEQLCHSPTLGMDKRRAGIECASFLSSPLPDTGSPRVNRIAVSNLPKWTDQLRAAVLERNLSTPKKIETHDEREDVLSVSKVSKLPLERRIIEADRALIELGLASNLELITENLRRWISRKIIQPLTKDIENVTEEFAKAGLEYLAPQYPATFSLFSSRPTTNARMTTDSSMIMLVPPSVSFQSMVKPQTLVDLNQKYPQDPVVQKRLRIERYLSFAGLASQRVSVIGKIKEMAQDEFLGSTLRWRASLSSSLSSSTAKEFGEHAQILINLFCTFMDENLPGETLHDTQPFSSRHFATNEESISGRFDAVQLQQTQTSPPQFQLIGGDSIYKVHPGSHNPLHAIVLFVEYTHIRHNGYLGVGNLASPAIDLISIIDTHY